MQELIGGICVKNIPYYKYKGYKGSIEYSLRDRIWHGKLLNCGNDSIIYSSDTVRGLYTVFTLSVDDYIKYKERGVKNGEVES